MAERPTTSLSSAGWFLTRSAEPIPRDHERGSESTAVPMHAADLMTIVATGNGQDVVDVLEVMVAQHGEFLTSIMMRSVLDHLDAEKFVQITSWDVECEPMRWTPEEANAT